MCYKDHFQAKARRVPVSTVCGGSVPFLKQKIRAVHYRYTEYIYLTTQKQTRQIRAVHYQYREYIYRYVVYRCDLVHSQIGEIRGMMRKNGIIYRCTGIIGHISPRMHSPTKDTRSEGHRTLPKLASSLFPELCSGI
jgi:hypothetical protein